MRIEIKKIQLFLVATLFLSACAKNPILRSESQMNENTSHPPEIEETTPLTPPLPKEAPLQALKTQVDLYKQRFNLKDVDSKLVDNRGDGYDDLYGTRNLRLVLHGIYYRGGANNKYNKISKRDNMNPLQDHALDHLCEQGFSQALYLYSENFATARKQTNCRTLGNQDQNLTYKQITGFTAANQEALIRTIYEHIKNPTKGPLYGHCWNGWHASGMVAAMALQQFCAWTPAQAEAYWVRNTDGNEAGYDSVRRRVRNYRVDPKYKISEQEQQLICP